MIEIETMDPTEAAWADVISQCEARLFLSPSWLGVLAETFGFEFTALTVRSPEGVSALPYALIDDARGPRIRSLPFCDLAPFPLATPEHWPLLEAELGHPMVGASLAVLPGAVPADPTRWQSSRPWVWHMLNVEGDEEALMERYPRSLRNKIRKPTKHGFVTATRTDAAAVDSFFDLHLGVRRHRHHLLAQPRALFHNMADRFWGEGRLEPDRTDGAVVTVEREGDVAAAVMVARYDDVAYYKFAASDPDHRHRNVNQAVVHGAATWAQAVGCTHLDLGRSDIDQPGLVRFKDQFRAESRPIERLARTGVPYLPGDELGTTLGRLTELLTDPSVPDAITEKAGNELYRYFA